MGKYIEVGVTYVDRDVDPPQSRTMGILQFDVSKPGAKVEELNPLDEKVIVLLKAYLKKHDAEVAAFGKALKV